MPNGPFAHVCLLVKDLDAAIEHWTKILRALDPGQLVEPLVKYEEFEGGEDQMRWATFVNPGGTEIQLMQPSDDSPLGRRLAKYGEGVHHLCFTTDDPEAVARRLAEEGINANDEVFSDPGMPWQRWTWVMPDSAHGTLVEVARPYKPVDGKWVSGTPGE